MSVLLSLPDACLLHILRALDDPPSQLRAAQACTRLHQLSAVDTISIGRHTRAKHNSLLLFLAQHGQHITSMGLGRVRCSMAELPSPSLVQLWISDPFGAFPDEDEADEDEVQGTTATGSNWQGLLPVAATGLTRLSVMANRRQIDAAAMAAGLAALPQLRHLDLSLDSCAVGALPGCSLSGLQHLTYLKLSSRRSDAASIDDGTLQHLSALTTLQELWLRSSSITCAGLSALPCLQQLTAVALMDIPACVGSGSTAATTKLKGMRSLQLYRCTNFQPTVLAVLTQLTGMFLDNTPLAGGVEGTLLLLLHLAGLQQLRQLSLTDTMLEQAPTAEAYSSLLASSCLDGLTLVVDNMPAGEPD